MYMQLLQILLVPLVFVFITYFAGSRWGAKAGWLSFIALGYSTFLTLLAGSQGGVQEFYNWQPIGHFGLNADGLSVPILFTIALLCTLMSIYSMPYMNHIIGEDKRQFGLYYALLLLYSVGMMGAVLATNLIEFYLFFELMLIPSYFLIAKWGYGERDRISFMYFMWTHIGALAFLVGILSIGYLTGSFDLATIITQTIPANLRALIVIVMVVGLLVKMAAFGLTHMAATRSRGSPHTHQRFTVTSDDRHRRLRDRSSRNVNPTHRVLCDFNCPHRLGGSYNVLRRGHGAGARRHQKAPGLL